MKSLSKKYYPKSRLKHKFTIVMFIAIITVTAITAVAKTKPRW